MPDFHEPSQRSRPRRVGIAPSLLALLGAVLLLAGCAVAASPVQSGTAGPAASPSSGIAGSPAPGASPGATKGPNPTLPSQTDTSWGRIWDDLPASFPRYPGAVAASAARDAVSAEFTVSADAAAVVAALRLALEAAGYSTASLSGPLEDGSRTVDSASSAAGCRVRTTVAPLGGLTHITVLFGAACPFR